MFCATNDLTFAPVPLCSAVISSLTKSMEGSRSVIEDLVKPKLRLIIRVAAANLILFNIYLKFSAVLHTVVWCFWLPCQFVSPCYSTNVRKAEALLELILHFLSSQGRVKLACHSDVRTKTHLVQCVLSFFFLFISKCLSSLTLSSPVSNQSVWSSCFPLVFLDFL